MTIRARLYLAATAAQHWGLAFALFLYPAAFASGSFDTLRDISAGDIQAWALGFCVVSICATLAALSGSEMLARISLTLSAMLNGFWALSFIVGALYGHEVGPSAYVVWATLVAKDLIVGYYPLTSPLEPVLRRLRSTSDLTA